MSTNTETVSPDGLRRVRHGTTLQEIAENAMQLEPAIREFGRDRPIEETMMALSFWLGSYLGASGAVIDFGNPPEGSVPAMVKMFYVMILQEGLDA